MNPQENYELFATDERDESWAYTMELAIQNHLAVNQKPDGALIEYVECRSRMCVVAGTVPAGSNSDFSEHLNAMRETGWWQLSDSASTAGGIANGEFRFVTFIPRDSADTLVPDFCN
jgi:hypothetical protein